MAIGAYGQAAPEEVGLVFLPGETEGGSGVFAEVGFADRVEQAVVAGFVVAEAVGVAVRADDAAAQGAAVVQGAGSIELHAIVIPTAGRASDRHLRRSGGALAHEVDRRRRVAGAGDQAGRAADHFDPVEHRQVGLHAVGVARVGAGQAIEHHVVDVEAARAVGLPAGAAGLAEEQAGGVLDHIVDAGHGLVVHALAGDHGHGLRGFAHGQRQLGGCGHSTGGVGLGAFGGLAECLAADLGGAQFKRCRGLFGIGRQRCLGAAEADGQCQ